VSEKPGLAGRSLSNVDYPAAGGNNSTFDLSPKTLAAVGVGLVAVGGASFLLYRHLTRDVVPQKWRRVGTVERIHFFPVKSCAPMDISKPGVEYDCDVLSMSFEGIRDRTLMVVNEKNEMITARVYPLMTQIKSKKVSPSKLVFSAQDMPDLELDFEKLDGPGKDVKTSVWGVSIDVMPCGDRINTWFSQAILKKESGLKLVHYPYPKPVRCTNPRLKSMPFIRQEDSVCS